VYAKALYAYGDGSSDDDLRFIIGDYIVCTEADGDWWTGR
jgi:hypothetical protein